MLDRREFGAQFQNAARALWCIAVAIVRDRNLAHDVVQEAAVVAWKKAGEFEAGTSFPAWAGQIVRYVALNELRKRSRSHQTPADPATVDRAESLHPARATSTSSELSPTLIRALDTLDDTAKACLIMRTVMDMTYHEIASALGIPEGTAMSHVHRSRRSLREHLSSEGGRA